MRTKLHIYIAFIPSKTSDRIFRCEDRALVEDIKRGWIAGGHGGYEWMFETRAIFLALLAACFRYRIGNVTQIPDAIV